MKVGQKAPDFNVKDDAGKQSNSQTSRARKSFSTSTRKTIRQGVRRRRATSVTASPKFGRREPSYWE